MTHRRIILHIGSPKCGSTFLQRAMVQSREAMRAHGINYPHTGTGHPGNAADIEHLTGETLEALFDGAIHTVLLSHEDLYALTKGGDALSVLALKAGITVQLLVFMRPFSEFVFGDYSQYMKQHFDIWLASHNPYDGLDFTGFAKRRVGNLRPTIFMRQWQRRFPETPLMLASHKDIRSVTEQLLDLPEGIIDWNVPRNLTNPSLRLEDCNRLAAAMREATRDPDEIRAMYHEAYRHTDAPDADKTPELVAWLEAQFTNKNNMLLQVFGFDNRLGVHSPLTIAPPGAAIAPPNAAATPRD